MCVESIIKDEVIIPLLLPLKCNNEFDNLCETWCIENDRNLCSLKDSELKCSKSADHDKIICIGRFSIC